MIETSELQKEISRFVVVIDKASGRAEYVEVESAAAERITPEALLAMEVDPQVARWIN